MLRIKKHNIANMRGKLQCSLHAVIKNTVHVCVCGNEAENSACVCNETTSVFPQCLLAITTPNYQ